MMNRLWMVLTIAGVVGVVGGGGVARAEGPTTRPAAAPVSLDKPFTESIPGTLVTFEMVPVKPEAGSSVKPFFIGKTELTWDAFDVWAVSLDQTEKEKAAGVDAESRPSKPYGAPDRGFGHAGYPALSMTHQSAQRYCEWLSKKTGRRYRVPTVAEWQAAYKAGETDPPQPLEKVAWFWDNANDKTHPVAKLAPNKLGVYDMLGNAGELATAEDGSGVLCGGTYADEEPDVRGDAVKKYSVSWQLADPQTPKSKWWLSDGPFVGFRVVCEP